MDKAPVSLNTTLCSRLWFRRTRLALGKRMLPSTRAKAMQKVLANTINLLRSTSIRARSVSLTLRGTWMRMRFGHS